MYKRRSESNIGEKFKSYVTGIMLRNFISSNKIDKYFRVDISDSMCKAIEENWIRILGIDYDIISLNMSKNNQPLGIALEGRAVRSADGHEITNRHYLHVIRPNLCIGLTNRFMVGDELLEVNGLKIYGMSTKDVISSLKKLPDYIQIVIGRSHRTHDDENSDNEDMNGPISFYDMNEDISSRTCTLKSNSSLFSTTSRDYGSTASVGDHGDGRCRNVSEYLRDIIGWRGPIVLEFRKEKKESLGLALEEISDPKTSELIIVFKIIVPDMKAAKDGRLHVGDRLLQVNGKSVLGAPFRKVCQWMKSSPGGRLILFICKPLFPALNFDSNDYFPDSYLTSTLSRTDKLEKLSEETDKIDIPPVPDTMENHLSIKRIDDKLGLFLDIVDNGKNGCRIRRMMKGQAKDNGTLREGDYITSINGLSLRIDDKYKLEHCLRIIAKSGSDYEISFISKEDVDLHKSNCINRNMSNCSKGLYPDASAVMLEEKSDFSIPPNYYDQTISPKQSFETYNVTLENDGTVNLGLVLCPSLIHPNKYVAITDIHPNSLADKSQSLKINDELLAVNNVSLERMTPSEVGSHLKKLLPIESILKLKIMRLLSGEDNITGNGNCQLESDNRYPALSDLPDMYFYILEKTRFGYGLSVKGLPESAGVVINEIDPESAAANAHIIKSDQRFVMIDNNSVCNCSVDSIFKLVKNSQRSISLIMETPKFREFNVKVVKDSSNALGLNVGGGIDTQHPLATIESIVLNTTCKFSEQLQPDDFIVEVNQSSMINLSHESIIQILRALPKENNFKIWRKIPFINRDFSMIDSGTFLDDYLQSSTFSVIINKPVSSITSFGIKFGDVVIVAPDSNEVLDRYKVVVSVDNGSLFEKYAPEVVPFCYIISVNGSIVDMDMSCDKLKEVVDSDDRVEIIFSRDIPYRRHIEFECDEPFFVDKIVQGSNYSSISDQDPIELASDLLNKRVHFDNSFSSDDNSEVDDKMGLVNRDKCPDFLEISDDIQQSGPESIVVNDISVAVIDIPDQCTTDDRECQTEPLDVVFRPEECESITNVQSCVTKQPVVTENNGEVALMPEKEIEPLLEQLKVIGDRPSPEHEDNELDDGSKRSQDLSVHDVDPTFDSSKTKCNNDEDHEKNQSFNPLISEDEKNTETEAQKEIDLPNEKTQSPTSDQLISRDPLILKDEESTQTDIPKEIDLPNEKNSAVTSSQLIPGDPLISKDKESIEIDSAKEIENHCEKDSDLKNQDKIDDSIPSEDCSASEEFKSTSADNDAFMRQDNHDNSQEMKQQEDDLGITITQVVVPAVNNLELGFQVNGGVFSGPNGESLPFYVIGVEPNTRNWLNGQQEPLLSNGIQLLELNGFDLTTCDLVTIEKLLASTEGDLTFKIIKTK